MTTQEEILRHKIIAILRGCDPANVLAIAGALYDGGVRLLEITLNSPGALEAIAAVAKNFGDRMIIGAGTVLTEDEVRAAVGAGARFILSPALDIELIRVTKALGVVSVPGAFTATEILAAWRGGADIVKVFPASVGPAYFRDIRGPLPQIPLMPTGGVTLDTINEFKKVGAVAFGVGSALVSSAQGVSEVELEVLKGRAKAFVEAVG
ncbi:bifunctional 4-hydroxy-2-oxoglutarate aldolase/2-dehydro-3-deoxy-phosphogluconate aldolase [Puia sp. P3]|uniref:bifunctional 4-hydroxy-2-oxoglutarate aldolase/2-dehydro-3-deoxy-phosphogluconate aldolase n=1 Tax=Puia sp. P3 TaxID=3423952 RepID=UPI003D670CEC